MCVVETPAQVGHDGQISCPNETVAISGIQGCCEFEYGCVPGQLEPIIVC